MTGSAPQTAAGKVLLHFAMSLDGFVATPDHGHDWMPGIAFRPDLIREYASTTGAVLGGRTGWDAQGGGRPYGSACDGPVFVLTHHPEDARPPTGSRSCRATSPRRCGSPWRRRTGRTSRSSPRRSAGSSARSATQNAQLLECGLIDEIDLHVAPILLGDGIRFYDNPGGVPVRLHRLDGGDPASAVDVRCRPVHPSTDDREGA